MAITRPRNLTEFTGCGAMGTSTAPAPGLAHKTPAYHLNDLKAAAAKKKKNRRAVESLLGEDEETADHTPAPSITAPPPVPLPKPQPQPATANAPEWATELLRRVSDLQNEVASLKAGPAQQHAAPPAQPPVTPTVARDEVVPPRVASKAASQVESQDAQHKLLEAQIMGQLGIDAPGASSGNVPSMSPAANLVETVANGGAVVGESLMGAGLPPPAAPSRKFIRPAL